jgi:hypothetical protein
MSEAAHEQVSIGRQGRMRDRDRVRRTCCRLPGASRSPRRPTTGRRDPRGRRRGNARGRAGSGRRASRRSSATVRSSMGWPGHSDGPLGWSLRAGESGAVWACSNRTTMAAMARRSRSQAVLAAGIVRLGVCASAVSNSD